LRSQHSLPLRPRPKTEESLVHYITRINQYFNTTNTSATITNYQTAGALYTATNDLLARWDWKPKR